MFNVPPERYAGSVAVQQALLTMTALGMTPSVRSMTGGFTFAPGFDGAASGGGGTNLLTAEQVQGLVTDAVKAAILAVNTVDPAARPAAASAAPAAAPAWIRRRNFPSLTRALKAARADSFAKAGFELEVSNAAKALWYSQKDDDVADRSIVWPTTIDQALQLFDHMGETAATKELDRLDDAIKSVESVRSVKAMSETGGSYGYALTGGTSGGINVPPEFLQSLFTYALAPKVALRRVPGVRTFQVMSNNVRLPRESVRAGASQAAEAGTLSSADATLAQQSITIEKQYAFRRWSNELADDSNPSFMEFLGQTVVRDVAIQQDSQYLQGNGSSPQIQGLVGYTGVTNPTLPNGTNGGSPDFDTFHDAVYQLDLVNADCDFLITHPRTWNTLRKKKDAEGRYLMSATGIPIGYGDSRGNPRGLLLDYIPIFTTTALSIALTVGTNTDCHTAVMGDSSQIVILERAGIELGFSEHIYFTTDEMAVRAIARSAIAILQPAAVETLTGIRA